MAAGFLVAGTSALLGIHDPLTVVLWVSWLIHPLITTWGCSEAASDRNWIVRWVKELRDEKQQHQAQLSFRKHHRMGTR